MTKQFRPVLCINRAAKDKLIYLWEDHLYSFNDRNMVDSSEMVELASFTPQVIVLAVMKWFNRLDENWYYGGYIRQGSETRLHDKVSLTAGGHVDYEDVKYILSSTMQAKDDSPSIGFMCLQDSLQYAAVREIKEETGLKLNAENDLTLAPLPIYTEADEVSRVHIGVLYFADLSDEEINAIKDSDEIEGLEWKTLQEWQEDVDKMEEWSKIVLERIRLQERYQ